VFLLGVDLANRRLPSPALIDAMRRAQRWLGVAIFLGRIVVLTINIAVDFVEEQDQAFDGVGDLEAAILSRLVILSDGEKEGLFGSDQEAPLSAFSARIRIGYALGIYDQAFRDDLNIIRAVRNAFGHVSRHIDFDTPAIAGACDHLHIPKSPGFASADKEATPKNRYLFTCMACGMILLTRSATPARPSTA
jgi:hypothetical protein